MLPLDDLGYGCGEERFGDDASLDVAGLETGDVLLVH